MIFFASPDEWRQWLAKHHDTKTELVVGFWKRSSGKPCMTWSESVDQALCFGWIDAVRRRIDDESYSIRFTRRRPTSIWSNINVAKVAALEEQGLMADAGRAAFALRREDRTGIYSAENPWADLDEEPLRADPKAWAFWEKQPPSYRKAAAHWVTSAKKPETRAKRMGELVSDSAAGLRVKHLRPRR